jgi:ribosomal protein S18 acetylase RimI-like enzyme
MMNIRALNKTDIDKIAVLFDAYRVFYEKKTDIEAAILFLLDRIENNESTIFVAENEERNLVGFVQLYPLFSSTRMKKLLLLNDLYVDEGYRGKGISLQLIDACKAFCKSTNACGLILETAKSNMAGNKLYPKTNFVLDNDHNYYSWDND